MSHLDPRLALSRTLAKQASVSAADKLKIRTAMWTKPRARMAIMDLLATEMEAAGFLEDIDWEALMKFILELIPVILAIITLFLDDEPSQTNQAHASNHPVEAT